MNEVNETNPVYDLFKKMNEVPKTDTCNPNSDTTEHSTPKILDSGKRREFESGAVRDIQKGKGRCDLLPLDIMVKQTNDDIIGFVNLFVESGDTNYLWSAIQRFGEFKKWDYYTMILEVAKQYEGGAVKYGDNNWRKDIPSHCYIDSALRHYFKHRRGDIDEPHDRAVVWNLMCCIWTCENKPKLNEYFKNGGLEK